MERGREYCTRTSKRTCLRAVCLGPYLYTGLVYLSARCVIAGRSFGPARVWSATSNKFVITMLRSSFLTTLIKTRKKKKKVVERRSKTFCELGREIQSVSSRTNSRVRIFQSLPTGPMLLEIGQVRPDSKSGNYASRVLEIWLTAFACTTATSARDVGWQSTEDEDESRRKLHRMTYPLHLIGGRAPSPAHLSVFISTLVDKTLPASYDILTRSINWLLSYSFWFTFPVFDSLKDKVFYSSTDK